MLRLTRKALYALEAVVDIAYNARARPVQSRDITKRQGIPQRYLEQVMQQLVRAGILKGVRGPRGGYTLARERRRITVGEIVRTIQALEDNGGRSAYEPQSEMGTVVIAPIINELDDMVMERLDKVTIEDLHDQAATANVPRADQGRMDFTI